MDPEEARQLLRRCQQEREDARKSLTEAQRTIESTKLIIQGLLKRYPDLADSEQEYEESWDAEAERPRGADAVMAVLQVEEERWFTVAELVEELRVRNWLPASEAPANAVRAAVERLVAAKDSNIEKAKFEDGVNYRYSEPDPHPKAAVTQYVSYDEEPF